MPNYIGMREALRLLGSAQRIMVIGCSGGGKSTLAQHLGTQLKLDYISIDRDVRWMAGWVAREASERRARIEKLAQGDRWIMDGTYPTSFDIRVPRSDLVLWVRVPRLTALFSVYKRVYQHYGTTRPEMAEGCIERLPDREFLSYIWNFEKAVAPIVESNLAEYGNKTPVLQLRSRQQMNTLCQAA